MKNRFDYVKYDEQSLEAQNTFKSMFVAIETKVDQLIMVGRAKSLIMTKLEEAYCWVGKAIRDEQIQFRTAELQEERSDE